MDVKRNRNYGYDILINTFEPHLRHYLQNTVLLPLYGHDWRNHFPDGVLKDLEDFNEEPLAEDLPIEEFFEELTFLHLKDIAVFSKHIKEMKSMIGEMSIDKFVEIMDELNRYRRKIAHAKSVFSSIDLSVVIDHIRLLCQGESGTEIIRYLDNEQYKSAKETPLDFYEEFECQNNLPPEVYDLDGGFVGRDKEIKILRKQLLSEQDRIITITGAGGVGKTAIALKIAYSFLSDPSSPFEAIIWFSAKTTQLTDEGIVKLIPEIHGDEQLIKDILSITELLRLGTTNAIFYPASIPIGMPLDHHRESTSHC